MAALSDDEMDDPVVQEINVFLSKHLAEQLFVFQYPVRPAHMPYDDITHLAARVKPNQQRVELEMVVNTNSANYAKSKGEQIAVNVDGGAPNQESFYTSNKMDKQVLTSVPSGISTARYVAGILDDKELHLTPLKGVIQLRPGFGYLDRADSKQQGKRGAGDLDESSQDEEEEAKAVTVRFAKRESEDAKARRMASYEYLSKKREGESWVCVHHHHMTEPMAEAEREFLYARNTNEVREFHVSSQEYMTKLIPCTVEEEKEKPPLPTNVLSLAELKTMTLGDQVRALMTNAKVLRFSQLMALLAKGTDQTGVLRALQQVAMLIQGCWVVKSEVLYPRDTLSANSGVPAESLCRARDYVMWRFTQSRFVVRKDIASVMKVPAEDVKDILEQMARLCVNKGWEFLLDYDQEFVGRHPEVVQRQQMLWDAKFQQLSKNLKIPKTDLERKAKTAEQLATLSPTEKPKRRRTSSTRSRTKSGGEKSMSDFSDNELDAQKGERARRHSGQSRARKNLGKTEAHVDSQSINIHTTNKSIANGPQESESVNGQPAQTTSLDLKKELLHFVSEKMHSRNVLSMRDLKTLFSLKLTECPPGHILGTGVSEKLLERTVYEVGGILLEGYDEPMFALVTAGDKLDHIRSALVDILQHNKGFRISVLRKKVEDSVGETTADSDIKKILRDYCLAKGGLWYLKGTVSDS